MTTGDIARLIPTSQALALTSHNLSVAKKNNKSVKDMIGLGATNIIGTNIIKSTADITAGI